MPAACRGSPTPAPYRDADAVTTSATNALACPNRKYGTCVLFAFRSFICGSVLGIFRWHGNVEFFTFIAPVSVGPHDALFTPLPSRSLPNPLVRLFLILLRTRASPLHHRFLVATPYRFDRFVCHLTLIVISFPTGHPEQHKTVSACSQHTETCPTRTNESVRTHSPLSPSSLRFSSHFDSDAVAMHPAPHHRQSSTWPFLENMVLALGHTGSRDHRGRANWLRCVAVGWDLHSPWLFVGHADGNVRKC